MKRRSTWVIAALLAAVAPVLAQEGKFTDVEIVGHVYEPAKLAPTDEQLRERIRLPRGFYLQRFAEGLDNPRMIAVADDGTVYVTQRQPGSLMMLKDLNNDGVADVQRVVAHVDQLHGVAIRGKKIYLADVRNVRVGDLQPDGGVANLQTIIDDLPHAGQHPNRTLGFGPDGMLYISVGSTCNACHETGKEFATILRVSPEGGKREVFASGLRNTIGFGWHPGSHRLYGLDHGIDWLGDNAQGEELNEIVKGARYGWPYVYGHGEFNPQDEPQFNTQEEWARLSTAPVALYTPHSAPMQMVFYTGRQFPAAYRNDAFVAFHGSWNRKPPSGYKVMRLKFDGEGKFLGFEPFLSGFLVPRPEGGHGYLGRPTGLAVAADGALLVSDDSNNVIYRVAYGEAPGPGKP